MNKCMFMGFISSDIKSEVMNLKDGSTMTKARFSIACQRKSKDKSADFVQITALGKNAENIAKFFSKGRGIYVECHVNTGKYTNKEGKTVFTSDFLMDSFEFIPVRKDEIEAATSNDTHTSNEQEPAPNDFLDNIPDDLDDNISELPFR